MMPSFLWLIFLVPFSSSSKNVDRRNRQLRRDYTHRILQHPLEIARRKDDAKLKSKRNDSARKNEGRRKSSSREKVPEKGKVARGKERKKYNAAQVTSPIASPTTRQTHVPVVVTSTMRVDSIPTFIQGMIQQEESSQNVDNESENAERLTAVQINDESIVSLQQTPSQCTLNENGFFGDPSSAAIGLLVQVEYLYQVSFESGTSESVIGQTIAPLLDRAITEGILPTFFDCSGGLDLGRRHRHLRSMLPLLSKASIETYQRSLQITIPDPNFLGMSSREEDTPLFGARKLIAPHRSCIT
jgi:hypothetical protein